MLAPAKLNLYLDVLYRRDDGYHEIESVMQAIDLYDTLAVRLVAGDAIRLRVHGRACPSDDSNLVVRAARSFLAAVHLRAGLEADLQKNIPLGAGLGGGSSDAAAMLWALRHLVGDSSVDVARLAQLGGSIGSDVPFFFTGGCAIARGRGERIEPLSGDRFSRYTYVVLYPGTEVATGPIYQGLKLGLTKTNSRLGSFLEQAETLPEGGVPRFENALTKPFRSANPELAVLQDRLAEVTGCPFTVTGSGSAMFAACGSRGMAEDLARRVREAFPVEAFVCVTIPSERQH